MTQSKIGALLDAHDELVRACVGGRLGLRSSSPRMVISRMAMRWTNRRRALTNVRSRAFFASALHSTFGLLALFLGFVRRVGLPCMAMWSVSFRW